MLAWWCGQVALFLHGMIDLFSCFHNDSHPIRLDVEFKKDLAWWVEFFWPVEWDIALSFSNP